MPRIEDTREALAVARALPVDTELLRAVIAELSAIGSSELGFRVTGTPEDADVADAVAARMRTAGLTGVAVEPVTVDGWRFTGASVTGSDGTLWAASSLGGVPGTPPDGVSGPLVHLGDARRTALDELVGGGTDLRGAVAQVDWADVDFPLSAVGLELGSRGIAAVVVSCPPGGPWYQAPGALGSFDGQWHAGAPPVVVLGTADGQALAAVPAGSPVRVVLGATSTPGAIGHNVVGYLPGRERGPIVVGAHHDGWFRAAFDNASGVAAMLAMAAGLTALGYEPRHDLCFTSRTAEEYGTADAALDWCVGAWEQVATTHPEWSTASPFHLCVEASGWPDVPFLLEAPVELTGWAAAGCRAAAREGWLRPGWRVAPPVAATEQWPFLVAGVPGVSAYTWDAGFARSRYHTQQDTPDRLDLESLADLVRTYAYLLLDADADPDATLDPAARSAQLAVVARTLGPRGARLGAAATRHESSTGRAAFTAVGRGLHAVDAHAAGGLPHEQALRDVLCLQAALTALDAGDLPAAAGQLAGVGDNALTSHLSEAPFAEHCSRLAPDRVSGWAAASSPTASPPLWAELSSLRGEPGAREPGPWLRASLAAALAGADAELTRRAEAMADVLDAARTAATGMPAEVGDPVAPPVTVPVAAP